MKWIKHLVLVAVWMGAVAPAVAQNAPSPAPAASPASSCPPTAQMPTQEQMQAAMAAARDRGLLWRISKDGRDSYLYGTVHLGRMEWSFPGPLLRQALLTTDTLALELDLADSTVMQRAQTVLAAAAANAPTLDDALRGRIAKQAELACLPMPALASMHPMMQVITLTVLAGRWDGLDPSFAQEYSLGGFAKARGTPVVSLEDVALQFNTLIPSDKAQALRGVEQGLSQLENGAARRLLGRLAQIWERGALDEIENYEAWCECANTPEDRSMLKRLNDDRNPGLADGIDRLHAGGKRVLAAVGALHMAGPQALPKLMQARGYTVERLGVVGKP